MEIIQIANEIKNKIELIDKIRREIRPRGNQKARTVAEYEKALAIAIIKLKNGECLKIDDEEISKPPATITERIARGYVWKEREEMEKAEVSYKSCIVNLQAVEAELNGLQSINRYLENA